MTRLFILFFIVLLFIAYSFADTINVPSDQASIQAGIDAAVNGDTVLVADGTYLENINFKGKAITVASHLLIDADTSHISSTIIDGSNPSNPDSATVVTLNSGEDTTSVLMGFTITGGTGTMTEYTWGDETYQYITGGGVLCYYAGAKIIHNIVTNNQINSDIWVSGGGISISPNGSNSFAIVKDNQILYNTVSGEDAWSAGIDLNCNGKIKDNKISYNNANATNNAWGAVAGWTEGSFPRKVTFETNIISYNQTNGNNAISGGIGLQNGMKAIIINNQITNNNLNGTQNCRGAGIELFGVSDTTYIDKNIINNNKIQSGNIQSGGGIALWNNTGETILTNNIIAANIAANGAGINAQNSKAQIINNTVVNNSASGSGGGIRALGIIPVIINTIVWDNKASTDPQISGSSPEIRYSNIEGGIFNGEGNISVDPRFADSLFHLANNSASIGKGISEIEISGNSYSAPVTDFDGNPRPNPQGSNPDMGARENTLGQPEYLIIPDHYATIQEAINVSLDGDIILVKDGTYQENINFKGKAITIASEFFVDSDTSHISNTVIDGSNPSNPDSGSVVTFDSGEDTTSVLMGFTITGGSGTLSRYIWDNVAVAEKTGGGIFCYRSGARIEHNKIINNTINSAIETGGGGITCFQEDATAFVFIRNNYIANNTVVGSNSGGAGLNISCNAFLHDNVINNNTATSTTGWVVGSIIVWSQTKFIDVEIVNNTIIHNTINAASYGIGGGLDIEEKSNAYIKNNTVSYNKINGTTDGWGAGIYVVYNSGTTTISRNLISNNLSSHNGGGIALFDNSNSALIVNNIISKNSAAFGAGIRSRDSKSQIINNTIVNNHASSTGGGIRQNGKKPVIFNSIIWGNDAPIGSQLSGSFDIAYSNIEGQDFEGKGNFSLEPAFADTMFHLSSASPCVGNGADSVTINNVTYYAPADDNWGEERPFWRYPNEWDIGADESHFKKSVIVGISDQENQKPATFKLLQNYPNPFNPTTTIAYQLSKTSQVALSIYNLLGQKVATLVNKNQPAGSYKVEWDASSFGSGVYVYKISTDHGFSHSKKLLLIK